MIRRRGLSSAALRSSWFLERFPIDTDIGAGMMVDRVQPSRTAAAYPRRIEWASQMLDQSPGPEIAAAGIQGIVRREIRRRHAIRSCGEVSSLK